MEDNKEIDIKIKNNIVADDYEQKVIIINGDKRKDKDGLIEVIKATNNSPDAFVFHANCLDKYLENNYQDDALLQSYRGDFDAVNATIFLLVNRYHNIIFVETSGKKDKLNREGTIFLPNTLTKKQYKSYKTLEQYFNNFDNIIASGELYLDDGVPTSKINDIFYRGHYSEIEDKYFYPEKEKISVKSCLDSKKIK
jgi:hypothetical protein